MSSFDKLSPTERAERNRDRRREDAERACQYIIHDARVRYSRDMRRIDKLYEEVGALVAPRSLRSRNGMVLFG